LERELVMDLAGYREQRAALAFKRNHPLKPVHRCQTIDAAVWETHSNERAF